MKTRILALILISVLILSAAAAANIILPQKFLIKTPTGFRLVMPERNYYNQPTAPQVSQSPVSPTGKINELSQQKQFEKEDELKDPIVQNPLELSGKAKASILQWRFSRYVYGRINIPPGATAAYPIELSPADRANPLFASVDIAKYQRFQSANRNIFTSMIWASPSNYPAGQSIIYSQEKMQQLAHYIALLEAGQPFPFTAPPEGRDVNISGMTKVYNEERALQMYIPHIAYTLYIEVNHIVPWSILEYNENEKSLLLDGRKFINYDPANTGYRFYTNYQDGSGLLGITDWNPFYSYDFLEENDMIKPTQAETIYALTEWMRANIVHEALASRYSNRAMYGYSGYYPVDKVLNPPAGARHWTQGCSGTASLYSAMLRTVNIPVSINLTLGGHRGPLFLTANLALGHGDDPYNLYNRRAENEVPVEEIFYTIDGFTAMNHASPEPYGGYTPNVAEQANFNHNKRTMQTAYSHMAYPLLATRAYDELFYEPAGINATLENSLKYDFWKPVFDNVDEMMANLDAEITRVGEGDYRTGWIRIGRAVTDVP